MDRPLSGPTPAHNSYFNAYLDSKMPATLLTHETLLEMGQGALKAYFDAKTFSADRLREISRIWQDLLTTTRSRVVTDRYLTAACNAMCVLLECACSSSLPSIQDFGMSKETWRQCFEAILECFDEGKVKAMRQVLTTLANILTHNPNPVVSSSIRKDAMTQMTSIILLGETGRLKAALVAMDLFIRRVSNFDEVFQSVEYIVHTKQTEWSQRLSSFGVGEALHDPPLSVCLSGPNSTEPACRATVAFVVSLLMALLSRETQSAAIALYKTYSTTLIGSGQGCHLYSMAVFAQDQKTAAGNVGNTKRANPSRWIMIVQAVLEVHPAAITPFADFLFPEVFQHDPTSYREYADVLQKGQCNLTVLLAVVEVGCQMGLEQDPAWVVERSIRGKDVPSDQPHDIFGMLLSHADANIRVRTFALLLASPSTTAPLPTVVLNCLRGNMKYLYGSTDPQSRSEVMSLVRKFIIRLQGSSYSLHKSLLSSPSQPGREVADNPSTDLRQHHEFLAWFAMFLEAELRPDVSYQRHIMALKSIELLLRSGVDNSIGAKPSAQISGCQTPWPAGVSLSHPSLVCALLNLVMDPFEDVRMASSMLLEILGLTVASQIDIPVSHLVRTAEERASRTGRAYHADGAALLYRLDYTLMQDLPTEGVATKQSSKQAVIKNILSPLLAELARIKGDLDGPLPTMSLHTRLLGLRFILQDEAFPDDICEDETRKSSYKEILFGHITHLCQQVWQKVRTRLCNDSPENEEDDFDDEFVVGPKDILSYSWRALRDSSLLACAILDNPTFQRGIVLSPSSLKYLQSLGLLCMDQLSNLRHRGAFSTVAQTFFALCGRLGGLNDSPVAQLRDTWYENAVATIDQQATRLTRRSAGLPAMMVGLLNGCSPAFFARFIKSFIKRAEMPKTYSQLLAKSNGLQIELPQVHALNCLRDVVTNTRFRSVTEPYIMELLNLAATSLSCDIWAIRNCGLMLFRACTSRLARARISLLPIKDMSQPWTTETTISSERAQDVLDLALKLLNPACFLHGRYPVSPTLQSDDAPVAGNEGAEGGVPTERVFAALDLIGRISPSFHCLDHIERILLENSGSKVWQVRAQAARLCALRISPSRAIDLLGRVVDGMSVSKNQNAVHGRLLCAQQVVRLLCFSPAESLRYHLRNAASILKPLIADIMVDSMSITCQTTFLDVMNDAAEMEILSRTSGTDSEDLSFWLGEDILSSCALTDGPCFPRHESAAVHEAYKFFSVQAEPDRKERSVSKLRDLFSNLSKIDLNAAARFLVRIGSPNTWIQDVQNAIDDLHLFIITRDSFPDDIRSEAMASLATSIESKRFDPDAFTNMTEISRLLVYNLKPRGRDVRNAELRLEANLFALGDPMASTQVNADGQSDLSLWVAMLQDAASDDIETPTRLNAASSLLAFTPVLLSEPPALECSAQYLQIYLVLYDLLNDDDEDVRDVASSAASTILSSSERVPSVLLPQSPLAVSERLAFFLGDKFQCERHFCFAALSRIWFPSVTAETRGTAWQQITQCSIRALLQNVKHDSNILFEQEKQNLYIDEAREVELWSRVLKSAGPPGEAYLSSLGGWASTSLRDLIQYLDTEVEFDRPLGISSQGQILTLFVRVIGLAGIALDWAGRQPVQDQGDWLAGASNSLLTPTSHNGRNNSDNESVSSHWAANISVELKSLEELGRQLRLPDQVMRSIRDILQQE